jgi:hypothetical protein
MKWKHNWVLQYVRNTICFVSKTTRIILMKVCIEFHFSVFRFKITSVFYGLSRISWRRFQNTKRLALCVCVCVCVCMCIYICVYIYVCIYIYIFYGLNKRGFESRQGLGIFLFTTVSRPALGPIKPPIHWVPGALSVGVKRPGREGDHSPPSSTEVKNVWSYTSSPPVRLHILWLSLKEKHNENFTFCFTLGMI